MRREIQSTPAISVNKADAVEKIPPQCAQGIELYLAIIDTLPDLVWIKNIDGEYLACNPRFEAFLGVSRPEILGKTDYDFVEARLADLIQTYDQEVITQGRSFTHEQWTTFANDGHRELLEINRIPLSDNTGTLIGVLCIGHNITARKKAEAFDDKHSEILEMIATGKPASAIYTEIALLYEGRHPGMRCSMLELQDGHLMHGGAPSLPKEYCAAVHGLKNGPNVGSCGTSTYTGRRVLVGNIETDPKWAKIKHVALPHGMRCCWSEPIKDSSGMVLGAFGMYYDYPALPNDEESHDLKSAARLAGIVMERDHAQKRIRELAYNDDLTQIASRAHFYQQLEASIQRTDPTTSRVGLLYIDLDDFKSVNDSLGHDAGDLLLQEIARRLKQVIRDTDFVARLSGDEFCILVNDMAGNDTTIRIAQRCLELISKPVELATRRVTPACSIGIAHYPDDGQDLRALIKAADTSLYKAKEQGKNQYAFYTPELTQQAEYRFRLEQSLRDAVEQQQLSLVYQPQIQIHTGNIIGVEALSRWHHPHLGNVPPIEFISTAERIGMIKPLTEWVLQTACRQAVEWKKAGLPTIRMAVNISPVHFLDKDFVSLIKRVLDDTGMVPSELELEVTEGVVQTDQQNLAIFQELKQLGVLLAIDDFGTGYSSFASLKHLTVDCLKIDKYFIDDMLSDQKSTLLIGSMIEMCQNLEHEIIAEGVETTEQCSTLQDFGCEMAQGYLFSKPVSSDEISTLLARNLDKQGNHLWAANHTPQDGHTD